jgi:hypothetical protein
MQVYHPRLRLGREHPEDGVPRADCRSLCSNLSENFFGYRVEQKAQELFILRITCGICRILLRLTCVVHLLDLDFFAWCRGHSIEVPVQASTPNGHQDLELSRR